MVKKKEFGGDDCRREIELPNLIAFPPTPASNLKKKNKCQMAHSSSLETKHGRASLF